MQISRQGPRYCALSAASTFQPKPTSTATSKSMPWGPCTLTRKTSRAPHAPKDFPQSEDIFISNYTEVSVSHIWDIAIQVEHTSVVLKGQKPVRFSNWSSVALCRSENQNKALFPVWHSVFFEKTQMHSPILPISKKYCF